MHTMALKTDGSLWSWGANYNAQLGINSTTYNETNPVQVGSEVNWKQISAGMDHSTGLKNDGSAWSWGANNSGQLGNGSRNQGITPSQIGSDVDWIDISAGGYHNIALKGDGVVALTPTLTGDNAVCQNATAQLTASISGTATWSSSDETVATVSATGLVTGIQAGIVTITYTVTVGNASGTATKVLTINALPTLSITGLNGSYCKSASAVALSGLPAGGSFTIDGIAATILTPSVLSVGNHTVVYNFSDANGCSNSISQSFIINEIPATPVVNVLQPTCSVTTGSATIENPVLNGVYSFDNGATYQANLHKAIMSEGTYSAISKNSVTGCISPTTEIVINAPLAVPAKPVVNVAQPTCTVSTGTITITSPSVGVSYSFDNGASYETSNVKTVAAASNYTVVAKDNISGCVSLTTEVSIAPLPNVPTYSISASKMFIGAGETVTLSVVAACTSCTYNWSNGQTGNPLMVTPSVPTTYTVSVTNTNGDCPVTASTMITVYPANTFVFDPSKCYKITNKKSGKALSVSGNNTANNTPAILTAYSGGANQKWQLATTSDGFVKIKGTQSGRFLTNNSTQNNTQVYVYDYAANDAADWKMEHTSGGYYRISHKKSGKSLDITNNSAVQDANAVTKQNNSNDGQLFKIEEVICENGLSLVATTTTDQVAANVEANKTIAIETAQEATATPSEITKVGGSITEKPTYKSVGNAVIFPNPASTYFQTDLSAYKDKAVTIMLYNQIGALVATHQVEIAGSEPAQMDVSKFQSGNYIVRIVSKGTIDLMKKIVIMK